MSLLEFRVLIVSSFIFRFLFEAFSRGSFYTGSLEDDSIYIVVSVKGDCPQPLKDKLELTRAKIEETLKLWGAPFKVRLVANGFFETRTPYWQNGGSDLNYMPIYLGDLSVIKKSLKKDKLSVTEFESTFFRDSTVPAQATSSPIYGLSSNLKTCDQGFLKFRTEPLKKNNRLKCLAAVADLDSIRSSYSFKYYNLLNYGGYFLMAGVDLPVKNGKYDVDAFIKKAEKATNRESVYETFWRKKNETQFYTYYVSGFLLHEIAHALNGSSSASDDHAGSPGEATAFNPALSGFYIGPDSNHSSVRLNYGQYAFDRFFSHQNNALIPTRGISHVEAARLRYCGRKTKCN